MPAGLSVFTGLSGARDKTRIAGFQRLQRAENLRHGDPARRRWRHAADLPAFVVGAQRRAFLGLVALQIIQRQAAGVGVALHLGDDLFGDRAFVQRVRAFVGDAFEHGGQRRVLQARADGFDAAIGVEEVRGHVRRLADDRIGRQQRVQARRNRKALLGQFDRRFEQLGPWQATVLFMRHFQRAQHARCPDRAPADLRLRERHRFAVGLQEQLLGGAGRCGFATVIRAHLFAVPQHDHRAATDPGRLRLNQGQHRLHRNRRINRRTALTQHLAPGLGGQRIGSGGHVFAGVTGLQIGAVTGSGFRCQRQGRGGRGVARGEGQGADDQRQGRQAKAAQGQG